MKNKEIPFDLTDVVEYFRYHDERNSPMCGHNFYMNVLNGFNGISPLKDCTVYDIGFGDSEYLPELSKAVGPNGKVLGIDIWPEKVENAVQTINDYNLSNVEVFFGDGRDLSETPLEYGKADTVLLIEVLQHLNRKDSGKMLDEAAKACNKQGEIVLGLNAKEYYEGSLDYYYKDEETKKLVSNGEKLLDFYGELTGSIFSSEEIKEELIVRGFSPIIHSYSHEEVFPPIAMGEPKYIKSLPIKHFVVARQN